MRDAFTCVQRLARGLVEADVLRQHDRGGAHHVRGGIDAVGLPALLHGLHRFAQPHPRHDHAVVGRDQVLFAAVLDRAHAFLDGGVLHRDACNPAIGLVGALGGAVDHVVIVLVHHRAEAPRDQLHVDAAAVAHGGELVLRERPCGMVREAPGHAVLVVDRHPGVAVERILAVGRDHAVERHDPLCDAPVELAYTHLDVYKRQAQFDAGVRRELDLAAEAALDRLRGHLDALAGDVVFPAVIGAAQPILLVASEPERHAAMGAELVDHADAPLRVTEGKQPLGQELDPHRRRIGLGYLGRQ